MSAEDDDLVEQQGVNADTREGGSGPEGAADPEAQDEAQLFVKGSQPGPSGVPGVPQPGQELEAGEG